MNKVILVGRLTRDPDVRYSQGENATAVARYTLAVDRRFRRDGDQSADVIRVVRLRHPNLCRHHLRDPLVVGYRPPDLNDRAFILGGDGAGITPDL